MRAAQKRVLDKENDIIGNLKDQFIKNNLRAQRVVGVSPTIAAGNTALGYYRGLAWGRHEAIKDAVTVLKKQFPQASEHLKKVFESDYKYK